MALCHITELPIVDAAVSFSFAVRRAQAYVQLADSFGSMNREVG
jgi:hypothetical protein